MSRLLDALRLVALAFFLAWWLTLLRKPDSWSTESPELSFLLLSFLSLLAFLWCLRWVYEGWRQLRARRRLAALDAGRKPVYDTEWLASLGRIYPGRFPCLLRNRLAGYLSLRPESLQPGDSLSELELLRLCPDFLARLTHDLEEGGYPAGSELRMVQVHEACTMEGLVEHMAFVLHVESEAKSSLQRDQTIDAVELAGDHQRHG